MDKHTYTYIGTPRRKKPWWEIDPLQIVLLTLAAILLVTVICMIRIDKVCKVQDGLIDTLQDIRAAQDGQAAHMEAIDAWLTEIEQDRLTSLERDTIERVVAAEARGETLEGMVAVAQVIKDRGDLWGMDYFDVATAPGQFAPPYAGEISGDVREAVSLVFDYGVRAFEDPVTHFHANYVHPYWTAGKIARGEIGHHKFYF